MSATPESVSTPAALAANANDYAFEPSSVNAAVMVRLSATGATRTITGLANGYDLRTVTFHNVGTFDIVLADDDGGSSAANRLSLGGAITLRQNQAITLQYDETNLRWRAIGGPLIPLTTDGDMLVRADGVTTRLPAGAAGQVLSIQAGDPAWATPTSFGGLLVWVATATVTGSPATNITISGLDLDAHAEYLVEFTWQNDTESTLNPSFFVNGDTTASNYRRNFLSGNGTTITGQRGNDAIPAGIAANDTMFGHMVIRRDFDGFPKGLFELTRGHGTTLNWVGGAWQSEVAANVTSFTWSSSVASGFSVGSTVKIFRITPSA